MNNKKIEELNDYFKMLKIDPNIEIKISYKQDEKIITNQISGNNISEIFEKLFSKILTDDVCKNPISELNEYCHKNKLPMPDYDTKINVYNNNIIITCTINEFSVTDEDKKKKTAKKNAAYKMLNLLKNI